MYPYIRKRGKDCIDPVKSDSKLIMYKENDDYD